MVFSKIRLIALPMILLCGTLFAASDWESAAELRKNDEIDKAERLLKKYASPANFEQLPPPKRSNFYAACWSWRIFGRYATMWPVRSCS